MKKMLILFIGALLMSTTCDEKDKCGNNDVPEHTIEFYIAVHIADVNTGEPIENYPVHVAIQKHFCNDNVDEAINDSGNTDLNGSFFANHHKKSYTNKYDYVEIVVYKGVGLEDVAKEHFQVTYNDIKDQSIFIKNFNYKI